MSGPTSDRTILVVSPVSGGGRALRASRHVHDILVAQGRSPELVVTDSGDHAESVAAEAGPSDLVVSLGGDGLHARVVAGAVRGGAVLAPLPGGRGNDFVRALRVPHDARAAAQALSVATERRVDVGRVGGRHFVGVATVGFDSVANTIANETTWLAGPLVYAWGGVRALLATRPRTFHITVDGEHRTLVGLNVAVGNSGRYGGGMRICPSAELDDGHLDLVTVAEVSRTAFARILLHTFPGTHLSRPGVSTGRARTIHIDADEPLVLFADGDPVAVLPVEITCEPGALRVLA
ncbi:diacylglycerol kinase family protein [Intrasporangium sp. DVR]|uniref:diacylglycerol/lipid kinase family protein n=1 Tax=Intrasporangium sp. DVR TaxID=3127867 RepID=UPI00313A621F